MAQHQWMKMDMYDGNNVGTWQLMTDKQSQALDAFCNSNRSWGGLVGEHVKMTLGTYGSLKKYQCSRVSLKPNCELCMLHLVENRDPRWTLHVRRAEQCSLDVVVSPDQNLLLLRGQGETGTYDISFSMSTVEFMTWEALCGSQIAPLCPGADMIFIKHNGEPVVQNAKVKSIWTVERKSVGKAKAKPAAKAVGKAKAKPAPKAKGRAKAKPVAKNKTKAQA